MIDRRNTAPDNPDPTSFRRPARRWPYWRIVRQSTAACAGKWGTILFHSEIFLLVFLPLVLAGYYAASRNRPVRSWLLIAGSLVFYGYWDVRLLPLLAASIGANWIVACIYGRWRRAGLIALGVAFNLALLAVFKYADMFADTFAFIGGWQHQRWNIVLPLAISFFTFQQISYIVDLGRGRSPVYGFRDYVLYVSFFPQLIAGPIVRHHEIIPQYELDPFRPGLSERLGQGVTMFVIGLAKKVIIADQLARLSDDVFAKALDGAVIATPEAWAGLLAFTFQLYFDFSGYSDMAIGLGLMFGFSLPFNFDRPYAATSIRNLWSRWHMTLTRFMRDYLYRPIGLRLRGPLRESIATLATMTLIGLWHGAAWTFALFGVIHGAALIVNTVWRRFGIRLPSVAGWILTFGFFALSLCLFRSESVPATFTLLGALFGADGFISGFGLGKPGRLALIAVAACVSIFGPTSQSYVLERMKPSWPVSFAASSLLLYVAFKARDGISPEFVYFQF